MVILAKCDASNEDGDTMALENIRIYEMLTGDNTYPHSGDFTIGVAGKLTVDDSNGTGDTQFGDNTDTGSGDVPDQDVTTSTVAGINAGDTVDSRYYYEVTGSDGSSGRVYFIASNGATNYGDLMAANFQLTPGVTYTFGAFNREGAVQYDDLVPCFTAGTRIETDDGDMLIEHLMAGDMVETMDHGMQPIRWIGSTTRPAINKFAPILFRKGALGNRRDLLVSPQHRMLISGWRAELMFGECEVLVPAKALLSDHKVIRKAGGLVTYFHILFDQHEIIFAEGCPSESFQPSGKNITGFDAGTYAEIIELFPELAIDSQLSNYSAARYSLKYKEGVFFA